MKKLIGLDLVVSAMLLCTDASPGKLLTKGSAKKTSTKDSDHAAVTKENEEDVKYWERMEDFHRKANPDGERPAQEVLRKYFQKSAVSAPERNSLLFEKKAFSNRTRVLMVAGLEGTGHHALRAVLNPCFAQKICVTAVNLTSILFYRTQTSSLGLYGAGDTVHYDLLLDNVLSSFKDIAKAAKNTDNSAARYWYATTTNQRYDVVPQLRRRLHQTSRPS